MYQVKIVDTNGRTSVQPLGKREERRVDAQDVEHMLQHPEDMRNECAIIRRRGFISMRREFPEIFELAAKMDIMTKLAG